MDKCKTDSGKIFERLLKVAFEKGIDIKFCTLNSAYGLIRNNCIGLHNEMGIEEINYTLAHELAHELAHLYIHYGKSDIAQNYENEYEEQAERVASLILEMASY